MMKKIDFTTVFTAFIILIMAVALVRTLSFPFLAAIYPAIVSSLVLVAGVIALLKHVTGSAVKGGTIDIAADVVVDAAEISARRKRSAKAFGWALGYYLLIVLLGFKLGSLFFMTAFIRVEAKIRLHNLGALIVGTIIILNLFQDYLNVFWPLGVLGNYLGETLPWMF